MVSKEEVLEAIAFLNRYKTQVREQPQELEEVFVKNELKPQPLSRETLVDESGLSTRARNVLHDGGRHLRKEDGVYNRRLFRLGDYEGMRIKDLLKIRTAGKKTAREIQELFLEAGIFVE